MARFLEEAGIEHLPVLLDPSGRAPRPFGVRGLPTTVLIDQQGRWIGGLEGTADWSSPEVMALIDHYRQQAW